MSKHTFFQVVRASEDTVLWAYFLGCDRTDTDFTILLFAVCRRPSIWRPGAVQAD